MRANYEEIVDIFQGIVGIQLAQRIALYAHPKLDKDVQDEILEKAQAIQQSAMLLLTAYWLGGAGLRYAN